MQNSSASHRTSPPLRSPPSPSSDDLDEELERLDGADAKRPHFLDYDPVPPSDLNSIELPIVTSALHASGSSGKKHFLDENPIRPDYDYQPRHPGSLDRAQYIRDAQNEILNLAACPQSIERIKLPKRPRDTMDHHSNNGDDVPVNCDDVHPEIVDKVNEYVAGVTNNYLSGTSGEQFGNKVDCVYSLLSMIGHNTPYDISCKFLELSKMPGTSSTLRGSIPWLVATIHAETDEVTRKQARQALHNFVHQQDDKSGRREAKVLRHIEQIMSWCDTQMQSNGAALPYDSESHPLQAMNSLMRVSFDQEHRHVMCQLGGLQTIAEVVHCDHSVHTSKSLDPKCILLRRYAAMALTNLTFGDGNNKALLCANKEFMRALVAQVATDSDDLLQVTANVLRNLAWRADQDMKNVLNEIGAVRALTEVAMRTKVESSLRAVMSALWNLSAHKCNKDEILMVDGALIFFVEMLTYDAPSKTQSVVENAGGILNNISSHIAVNEEYRRILRQRNCLGILLKQLKSESLTVVGNACGTLWNLSARCAEDQKYLRENGAVPMLKSLLHSKHKIISTGSRSALKNLVNFRAPEMSRSNLDPVAKMIGLKELPSLNVRKQRALEEELDQNLSETCDEIDDKVPSANGSKSLTGTIPKRTLKTRTSEDGDDDASSIASSPDDARKGKGKRKAPENDLDQITNFALLDDETHKTVVEEDSTKCYDMEGTPHAFLSTAASLTDLHTPLRPSYVGKHSKSGRNTTDNSGIHTPEKPIFYCEEGTPMHFSNHDSFSSLDEEHLQIEHENRLKMPPHPATEPRHSVRIPKNVVDSVPISPGGEVAESAAKSVRFNEETPLETPMMFSRTSSMDSLPSIEAANNDDRSSVVSEFSRMPSGIISPSELPDSPSQTMPQSPRHRRRTATETPSPPPPLHARAATSNAIAEDNRSNGPFDAERTRTYDVENTPAHISYATSLSNLSFDEEKISADSLHKEMRLMHQLSDEQDELAAATSVSALLGQVETAEINDRISSHNDESSDSDGSENDGILLAKCINIGMKGSAVGSQTIFSERITTPPLSLPIKLQNSTSSDEDDYVDSDLLLQQCIRDGMQTATRSSEAPIGASSKSTERSQSLRNVSHQVKENPIVMLRKGGNSYLDGIGGGGDETNRFNVENTPCNFSVISQLSALTIGSNGAEMLRTNVPESTSVDRSLSPTSVDSEEDRILLNQAIAAGTQSKLNSGQYDRSNMTATRSQQPSMSNVVVPEPNYIESNHSMSSIDSTDSYVNSDELLQHVIKVGMRKESVNSAPLPKSHASQQQQQQQRRSQLPLLKTAGPSSQPRDHRSSRERKEEQLLLDCINTGIERIRINSENVQPRRLGQMSMNVQRTHGGSQASQIAQDNSKNFYTTSAAVLEPAGATSTAPDVVTSHREGTITETERVQHRRAASSTNRIIAAAEDHTDVQPAPHETGYSSRCATASTAIDASFVSTQSHSSGISAQDLALLEQSNEYPATLGAGDGISDSEHSPCMNMDVSNEFPFEQLSPKTIEKHKDPDLMLQSVERLTHDFVSTAEYLRTTKTGDADDDDDDEDDTLAEDRKSSQNTWNDDSNEVSFPSISRTAPIIASFNGNDSSNSSAKLLEDTTPTNESKTIVDDIVVNGKTPRFEIGGEINQLNFTEIGPAYKYGSGVSSFDTTSTMTNSTIITMEANKIRTELMLNGDQSDSTMSLDKIRPPSVMDKLSYCEPYSIGPSSLKTSGKFLHQGFMARRALNNGTSAHGSLDSINSSCNVDRIKPPSLMDDLLDSMMSVDSIASEFVDAPTHHVDGDPSKYETALSECDDLTITLQNCVELPMDSTPCGSDFSSAESTPKKSRRSLTPRQKRELARERYQTYTITTVQQDGSASSDAAEQEKLHPINDSDGLASTDDDEMSSIRALTKKLTYLQDMNINTNTYTKKSSDRLANKASISRPEPESESNSSQQSDDHQQPNSIPNTSKPRIVIPNGHGNDTDESKDSVEFKGIRGRKKPSYVSPYKMTKLTKPAVKPVSPPVVKPITPSSANKSLSPRATPSAMIRAAVAKSPEPAKTSSPSIARAKSLIQRSAESLRKIRPAIASKLTKQISLSPTTSTPVTKLNRQKSADAVPSPAPLIRQNTFTKDEPSTNEIPVIASEPTSPKRISKIATKIPFNRSVSATVTKCRTNIEIPSQKNAANIKRNMKSATSASHIMSPSSSSSSSPRIEQKPIVADVANGRNIFKRFAPLQKSNSAIQSKLPSINAKTMKTELKPSASSSSIPMKSKLMKGRLLHAAK